MTYIVTARKWRPMVFEDIVGQGHVATTLRNAIAKNRLSHAYIFSGPRGVGKTTTARILAKAINCLHPVDVNPDNECELCREITEGRSLNVFEIDGASNRGVDEIRNLREAVRYAPAKGRYKVYIIDEVHMLTKEAFNALLKTLEEPPPSIVFIFATTEIHKVPSTILSRCQRFDFRRISIEEIIGRLRFIASQEKITIGDEALFVIAKRSDGSLRDAQSIFDQIVSFCGKNIDTREMARMLNVVDEEIFFRTTDIIANKNAGEGLSLIREITSRGYDLREFLAGLMEHLRSMLVVCTTESAELIETSEVYKKRYLEAPKAFNASDLLRLLKIAAETDTAIRWDHSSAGGRLKLEIGLMQMIRLDRSVQIDALLRELDELKKKVPGEVNDRRAIPFAESGAQKPVVRGSVKASQPALRPEQIVEPAAASPRPSRNFPEPSTTVPPARPAVLAGDSPDADSISIDEAQAKWPMLIDEACKKRIAVGTMLRETALVGVSADSLRISCPDDFHLDQLRRNREFISELAQNIYGAKVRLDTILATARTASSLAHSEPPPKESPESAVRRHPVIQALIREFGAKEVE
ncbi:MAG: DNA polymerase III subunit gamma/tau [Ignavibacteria bacterium]|nr:MAG: DNA polymerase III subunit gamma/tau [Ignavibacteria bacterium]